MLEIFNILFKLWSNSSAHLLRCNLAVGWRAYSLVKPATPAPDVKSSARLGSASMTNASIYPRPSTLNQSLAGKFPLAKGDYEFD